MEYKKKRFERLIKKGVNISLNILDNESWQKMIEKDRSIPRTFKDTQNLIRTIFGSKEERTKKPTRLEVFRPDITPRPIREVPYRSMRRGHISRRFEECHEELYVRLYSGLSNPNLSSQDLDTLEGAIDDVTPNFEKEVQTKHFILRWTNNSTHIEDNIADPLIVKETGDFLEEAWRKYENSFGRTPYLPIDAAKMEVIFQNIISIGLASPPDGPIQFDSKTWVSDPGVRRPTSAHELFHKLQYAFGFRTKHTPSEKYAWFSEGTASWAEVFVWQKVSGSYKILDLFDDPDYNLYQNSYEALPYWIFFETRQTEPGRDNPISELLQKYYELDVSTVDPEREAYSQVINNNPNNLYKQKDNFFALFSRCRRLGEWRNDPDGKSLYPQILDPYDNEIEPILSVTEANIGSGDTYTNQGNVSEFGSDYYRMVFEEDADKKNLTIKVDGSQTGNYSYYIIWEHNGQCKNEEFPSALTEGFNKSWVLDLSSANSLSFIISGRGKGGDYSLTASIT